MSKIIDLLETNIAYAIIFFEKKIPKTVEGGVKLLEKILLFRFGKIQKNLLKITK